MTGLRIPPGSLGPWSGGDVAPGVTCLLAPNAGPMTLDGTNTWVVSGGSGGDAVIIDPGPSDPDHLSAIRAHLDAQGLRPVVVVLTHGHHDHSEGARELAEALGVGVRSVDPHWRLGTEGLAPDDVIGADGFECRVVLTPGHSSDSASLVLRSAAITGLLTGDTVLGRGTTVVAHPDGRLSDYLASLRVLRERAESAGATDVLPGHGPRLADPVGVIDYYLAHRAERLEQVRAALARTDPGEDRVWAVVERVYADVPQTLWPAAAQSVRAQIDFLEQAGPGRAD